MQLANMDHNSLSTNFLFCAALYSISCSSVLSPNQKRAYNLQKVEQYWSYAFVANLSIPPKNLHPINCDFFFYINCEYFSNYRLSLNVISRSKYSPPLCTCLRKISPSPSSLRMISKSLSMPPSTSALELLGPMIQILQSNCNCMHEHISADRLIGHHRAREDYKDSAINTLQFAYGDHRYTKMTFELLREDDELKEKTLTQLVQDFSLAENVSLALLSSDLLSVLLQHLKNKNQRVRHLSVTICKKICATPLGRKTVISRDCVQQIQALIHDGLSLIKLQAYEGLIELAEFTQGINCILQKGQILTQLVDKLLEEKTPQILLRTVGLLRVLMQGEQGTPKALKTQAISRLMGLLPHSNQQIQFTICMTLANISFNESGKAAIVAKGHIKQISKYITNPNKLVRQASALLLCSLGQLNQGKIQILQHCPFANIERLLDDESATVLNAVQLIANLAENPKGRALASKIEKKLEGIKTIERKYIDETLQVIRWTP